MAGPGRTGTRPEGAQIAKGERYRLVQRFGGHVNAVRDARGVGEGDAAQAGGPSSIIGEEEANIPSESDVIPLRWRPPSARVLNRAQRWAEDAALEPATA